MQLALLLLTWVGGGTHAAAISHTVGNRIAGRTDPAVAAARVRMERRAEGRRLVATQPALAKELGIGRPDLPGADDYGVIDINHAPAQALTRLPGVTESLATRIAETRAQTGGFSSIEELGLLLDLPPAAVDQMRDMALFTPN